MNKDLDKFIEFSKNNGVVIEVSNSGISPNDIVNSMYKKEPKWLYRLESESPENGLWYNINNELVFGIGKLKDCKTKDLPMGYDERYHKGGRNWFSSCSNKEDLSHWYSLEDALELIENGFVFTKYLATEYEEYDCETTFIKETCLQREVLNIKDIWGDVK